ncbi:hypothetical protein [Nocardioides panzhihuensis]|uniref:Uncharacterized protein n=1 Tax=Nocardioides panzhihuensis TaxID=860243 RepID=A0A7Z0IVJ7_9ACTN|nr:hypothetical protein [Nocardioides panzhihuensis]NYI80868.1 hypothetical protein [Nocardioides panzhihuensis]
MSEPVEPKEPEWKRKQRLARIFGDVLPETTKDEREPSAESGESGESASDRWLKSQVPPHHGG